MSLVGVFTFKQNETISCPLSIPNPGNYGSQKLILKIKMNPAMGLITSTVVTSKVGVFVKSHGVFYASGTATDINNVLATLRYQHSGTVAQHVADIELRAYGDEALANTGGAQFVSTGTMSFVPYAWPAVTWDYTPKSVFVVSASAATGLVKLPTVSDSGVGLLRATVTPKTGTDKPKGQFKVPEASRDKGEADDTTKVTRFSGERSAVNAWLQAMTWTKGTITDYAEYTIEVTDGRTYKPATHQFKIAITPGIVTPDNITFSSNTPQVFATLAGTVSSSTIFRFSCSGGKASGTFSTAQTSYGSVTPSVNPTTGELTIIGSVHADVLAAIAGVSFVLAEGKDNIKITHTTTAGGVDTSGTLVAKLTDIALLGHPIDRTIVEDASAETFLSGLYLSGPTGLATYTITAVVSSALAGGFNASSTYGSATANWNSTTRTLTISGKNVADINTALQSVTFTMPENYDQDFTMTVRLVTNTGYDDLGVVVNIDVIPMPDYVILRNLGPITVREGGVGDGTYQLVPATQSYPVANKVFDSGVVAEDAVGGPSARYSLTITASDANRGIFKYYNPVQSQHFIKGYGSGPFNESGTGSSGSPTTVYIPSNGTPQKVYMSDNTTVAYDPLLGNNPNQEGSLSIGTQTVVGTSAEITTLLTLAQVNAILQSLVYFPQYPIPQNAAAFTLTVRVQQVPTGAPIPADAFYERTVPFSITATDSAPWLSTDSRAVSPWKPDISENYSNLDKKIFGGSTTTVMDDPINSGIYTLKVQLSDLLGSSTNLGKVMVTTASDYKNTAFFNYDTNSVSYTGTATQIGTFLSATADNGFHWSRIGRFTLGGATTASVGVVPTLTVTANMASTNVKAAISLTGPTSGLSSVRNFNLTWPGSLSTPSAIEDGSVGYELEISLSQSKALTVAATAWPTDSAQYFNGGTGGPFYMFTTPGVTNTARHLRVYYSLDGMTIKITSDQFRITGGGSTEYNTAGGFPAGVREMIRALEMIREGLKKITSTSAVVATFKLRHPVNGIVSTQVITIT